MKRAWDNDIYKALHVVTAYDVENGIILYPKASDRKGKEREIARNIIDMLSLKNCVVTMDALHCQKDTMAQIVQQQGDFVVQLKANQGKLFQHLPPYSPNMNPIERLWKVMNEQVRNNHYFASPTVFRQKIHQFFRDILPGLAKGLSRRINDNFQTLKNATSS